MTRASGDASRLAYRFYQVSIAGLVVSGYLAFAASDYLTPRWAILAGLAVLSLLAGSLVLTNLYGKGFLFIKVFAALEFLGAALLSTNLSFFLFLAAFVVFLVATQAAGEVRRSTRGRILVTRGGTRKFQARLAALTVFVAVAILALTAGFFFVLPRTAHAAFSLASDRFHVPGFSGEVRLGQIGAILRRSTPVLHVRIVDAEHDAEDPPPSLKWRGAALSSFDGRRWTAPGDTGRAVQVTDGRSILADDDQRRRIGVRITYEVQQETSAADVLFLTGTPEVLWVASSSVYRSPTGVYRLPDAARRRLRYGATSFLDPVLSSAPPGGADLKLPMLDERIPALARQITAGADSDRDRALALENYFRSQFQYTTELPVSEPADPLAHFLFERRKGHCEYFASSMAVMLRSLGVPSRLVTGFQGGLLNPITGWYVVRASDAHTWVEAWIGPSGWTTYDPTPSANQLDRRSLLTRVLFYTDAAEMFWQDWVVGYDLQRQVTLAARMQSSGRDVGARWIDGVKLGWQNLRAGTVHVAADYGVSALILALAAIAVWLLGPKLRHAWQVRRRVRKAKFGGAGASDATLLYQRMLRILKRKGYEKPAWATPGEFVRSLPPSETAQAVADFTIAYHDLRYGSAPGAATRMLSLLDRLEG